MMAKVALLGDTFIIVKVNGIIGASLDAGLTTGAQLIIQDHDAIGSFDNRLFGTDVGTWRFIAVSAQIDSENIIELSIDHLGPVFCDRNEFNPLRCPVFLFAGNFTGLASPAGFVINFQGIGFHEPPP
jgi:hypothetical protein